MRLVEACAEQRLVASTRAAFEGGAAARASELAALALFSGFAAGADPLKRPVHDVDFLRRSLAPTVEGDVDLSEAAAAFASRAALEVDVVASRLSIDVRRAFLDADALYRRSVAAGRPDASARAKAQRFVARNVRKAVEGARRDWSVAASDIVFAAADEGRALSAARSFGPDPIVFKRVSADACRFCRALYLDGDVPRVFRLSDMAGNGSNVGRRAGRPTLKGDGATEWRPAVGPVHVGGCACELRAMPRGGRFDGFGRVVLARGSR